MKKKTTPQILGIKHIVNESHLDYFCNSADDECTVNELKTRRKNRKKERIDY
jgi:hypothetical protein